MTLLFGKHCHAMSSMQSSENYPQGLSTLRAERNRPPFFLKELRVEGFRSLQEATFNFQPTLNVIIGANNSGKTALIDSLRIILNLGSFQEKEDFIRLKASDICLDTVKGDSASIVFEAKFLGEQSDELSAKFYELDANHQVDGLQEFKLRYRVTFQKKPGDDHFQYHNSQVTGGEYFENSVSYDTLDYITSIYLAPLRDAVSDTQRLGREIEKLLRSHSEPSVLREIPEKVKSEAHKLITEATGGKHEKAAGDNLKNYASTYGIRDNALKFVPAGLSGDMLRSLQVVFDHGHHGLDKLGLENNGLGINNLIYSSIVLSRKMDSDAEAKTQFFLIEEPEAHLHPQSQDTFFNQLNEITTHQVFVTSHSPTITAKCDLDKVIVMSHPELGKSPRPYHIWRILEDYTKSRNYLQKFLDVTRSQLLFGRGALFVEGVTEALLMQSISKLMNRDLRANGIEVVVLGSNKGFEHFRVLTGANGLGLPCVFLTDGDEAPSMLATVSDLKGYTRKEQSESEDGIRTFKSTGTFEFELLLAALDYPQMQEKLKQAMRHAYGSKRKSVDAFIADFMDFEAPHLAYKKMKQSKVNEDEGVSESDWEGTARTNAEFLRAKSNFAYCLLEALSDSDDWFRIPPYIEQAIQFLVPEEKNGTNGGGD